MIEVSDNTSGLSNKVDIDVSIVICTYNRAQLLGGTLAAVGLLRGLHTAEVIVVDNSSTDDTFEVVHRAGTTSLRNIAVRYVVESRQGLSHARNTGISCSSGQYIAFLDDDASPSPQWLDSIRLAFGNIPDACGIGGPIIPNFEVERPVWLSSSFESYYSILDLGKNLRPFLPGESAYGANMAFRASFLRNLTFPPHLGRKGSTLLSGEDTWMFEELAKRGGGAYYVPEMTVVHHIGAERLTLTWLLQRHEAQGYSNVLALDSTISLVRKLLSAVIKLLLLELIVVFVDERKKILNNCRISVQLGGIRASIRRLIDIVCRFKTKGSKISSEGKSRSTR